METSTFFIRLNGKVYGPVDNKQLATLVKRGQVNDKTEISKDKTSWQQLGSVPSFRAYYQKYLESKEDTTTTGLTALIPPQAGTQSVNRTPAPLTNGGWFVKHNGKVFGPLSKGQLAQAVKKKQITQQAEVSKDQKSWQPLAGIPEFQNLSEYEGDDATSVSGIFNTQAPPERTVQSSTEDFFARAGVVMEGDHYQLPRRRRGFAFKIDLLKSKRFYTFAGTAVVLVVMLLNWTAVSNTATKQVIPWVYDNVIHPGAAEERKKAEQEEAARQAKAKADAEQRKREEEAARLAEEQAEKERLEAEALAEKKARKGRIFDALGKSLNCAPFPQPKDGRAQSKFVLAASESLWEYKDSVQVDFFSLIPLDITIDVEKKVNNAPDTGTSDEIRFVTIHAVTEKETTPFNIASITLKEEGLLLEWTKKANDVPPEKINPLLFSVIRVSSDDHEHYAGFFKPLTYRPNLPDSPALGKRFKIWDAPELQTLGASLADYRLEMTDTSISTQRIPFAKPFTLDMDRADNDKCPITFTKWLNFNERPIRGSFLLTRLPSEVQVSLKIDRTETETELVGANAKKADAEQKVRDWIKDQTTKERALKIKGRSLDGNIADVDQYFLAPPFDIKDDKRTPYQDNAIKTWHDDKKNKEEQWRQLKKECVRLQLYAERLRKMSEEFDSLENGPYRPMRFQIVIPLPVEKKTKVAAAARRENKVLTEILNRRANRQTPMIQNRPDDNRNNDAANSDKDEEDGKKDEQESEPPTYIPVPSVIVLSVE